MFDSAIVTPSDLSIYYIGIYYIYLAEVTIVQYIVSMQSASSKICKLNLAKECRGKCYLPHAAKLSLARAEFGVKKTLTICRFDQLGKCTRGKKCTYLHVLLKPRKPAGRNVVCEVISGSNIKNAKPIVCDTPDIACKTATPGVAKCFDHVNTLKAHIANLNSLVTIKKLENSSISAAGMRKLYGVLNDITMRISAYNITIGMTLDELIESECGVVVAH